MKKIAILATLLAFGFAVPAMAAEDAPKTKQVCKDVKGKKQCKTIKIHKKHEGTAVPEKAGKK